MVGVINHIPIVGMVAFPPKKSNSGLEVAYTVSVGAAKLVCAEAATV